MGGGDAETVSGLILALDTSATATGYVLGRRGRVEHFGIEVFKKYPDDTYEEVGRRVGFWLEDIRTVFGKPGVIVYEAPANANAAVKYLQNRPADVVFIHGILFAIHSIAASWGVKERGVNVNTHRRVTTGETRTQRERRTGQTDEDVKRATIDAINNRKLLKRPLRYAGRDHNIADAASVFVWACQELEGLYAGEFHLAGQIVERR